MPHVIPPNSSFSPRVGAAEVNRAMIAMGVYLRDYREDVAGKTQDEVAAAIGISRKTYAKIEAGENVHLEVLMRAFQHFGLLGHLVNLTCDPERLAAEHMKAFSQAKARRRRLEAAQDIDS